MMMSLHVLQGWVDNYNGATGVITAVSLLAQFIVRISSDSLCDLILIIKQDGWLLHLCNWGIFSQLCYNLFCVT